QVRTHIPLGGAGHGVGQTAPTRPVTACLCRGGGGEEFDVLWFRCPGRTRRAAVDAGGAHGQHELTVEAGVLGTDGTVAAFGVTPQRRVRPRRRSGHTAIVPPLQGRRLAEIGHRGWSAMGLPPTYGRIHDPRYASTSVPSARDGRCRGRRCR